MNEHLLTLIMFLFPHSFIGSSKQSLFLLFDKQGKNRLYFSWEDKNKGPWDTHKIHLVRTHKYRRVTTTPFGTLIMELKRRHW